MRDIERRVALLEGGGREGSCLQCECEQLNARITAQHVLDQPCTHRRRSDLATELQALNRLETAHVHH